MTDMTKGEFEELQRQYHNVDEQAQLVNTIILMRIYDVMLLLLTLTDSEAAGRLAKMHAEGEFLGEQPAIRLSSSDDEEE